MAQPRKHIPERTCVICRQTAPKRNLIRLVRTADQGVQVDPSGKRNGRGAYLCQRLACWQRAIQGEALAKALRTTLTQADRAQLEAAAHQLATLKDETS
ncbi:MAG: YlxR family protein [Aggregatilineales bacterium]